VVRYGIFQAMPVGTAEGGTVITLGRAGDPIHDGDIMKGRARAYGGPGVRAGGVGFRGCRRSSWSRRGHDGEGGGSCRGVAPPNYIAGYNFHSWVKYRVYFSFTVDLIIKVRAAGKKALHRSVCFRPTCTSAPS
jgi:hypothetical protein